MSIRRSAYLSLLISFICAASSPLFARVAPNECPNLVVNGSFEAEPAGKAWDALPKQGFSQNIEVQRNGIVLASADQRSHLELASNAPTHVTQTLPTQAGVSYEVQFAYRPRPSYQSQAALTWNRKTVYEVSRQNAPSDEWSYHTVRVKATGNDELGFLDTSASSGRERAGGAFIDHVSLRCIRKCPSLVKNGSFEARPDGQHWTVSAAFQMPDRLEIQRNGIVLPSFDGTAHLELASNVPTKVFQDVHTVNGRSYSLSFAYRPRPSYDSEATVYWNNDVILVLSRANSSAKYWQTHTVTVTGTGRDTLLFKDTSDSDGRERAGGAFIDDVSLCPLARVESRPQSRPNPTH